VQWVEKFRPTCLDDLLIDEGVKNMLRAYLDEGTVPNLMLAGTPGKGKTSLAEVLVAELGCDHLYINAGEERGIDMVRNKIIDFANAVSISADVKIIILDESDSMTLDAQNSLKNIIEKSSSDTRFIFTCNNISKMEPAIKSRCTEIQVHATVKEVYQRLAHILSVEDITVSKEQQQQIIKEILQPRYPDIRSMIQHLENCCVTGEFAFVDHVPEDDVGEIVDFIMNNAAGGVHNVRKCREFWIANSMKFSNSYDRLAASLFTSCLAKINDARELDEVNKYIVEFNHGAFDQEIIFTALVNRIGMALSK
jgi:DNA polymerase III delta prime subunit